MADQLLYLAMAILFGLIGARAAGLLRLPAVTGYLVAGLILGLIQVIPMQSLHGFEIVTDMALGFIAFSIGNELKWSLLKKLGKTPVFITLFETMGAVLVLFVALVAFGYPVPTALLLSAIGASTAPAATLMIVRQYRAEGPVTHMLLPVVAMDNTVALITFSVLASIAQVMVAPPVDVSILVYLFPLAEILASLLVGALLGLLLALLMRFFERDNDRLCLMVGIVFAAVGLASWLGLSPLLAGMATGASFSNLSGHSLRSFRMLEAFTPPMLLLFLVLSGAELNLGMLTSLGLMGALYILGRTVGKVGGCFVGAKLGGATKVVQKHLGFTLIPQAGVAIGLSLAAMRIFPEQGEMIRVVVLAATLIYELVGPVITRLSLSRAGEIQDAQN